MRRMRLLGAGVLLLGVTSGARAGAEPPEGKGRTFRTQVVTPEAGAQAAGARAQGPATRRATPANRAEARELAQALLGRELRRSDDAVGEVQRADGSVQADLDEGFQHAEILVRQPDGSVRVQCVDSVDGAAEALADVDANGLELR